MKSIYKALVGLILILMMFFILWFLMRGCNKPREEVAIVADTLRVMSKTTETAGSVGPRPKKRWRRYKYHKPTPAPASSDFEQVPIFFCTDRNFLSPNQKGWTKTNYFGSKYADTLYLGRVFVSIPQNHAIGNVESPSWWRVWDTENPKEFVTILKYDLLDEGSFYQELSVAVNQSTEKDAFVFIHGYNNSFEDAALRAGQLTYDLGFKGASILYSWASNGNMTAYPADEENVSLTVPHLKYFLEKVVADIKPEKINIVAHSMGNRALTKALAEMANENSKVKFNQIILAAPDIDKRVFEQQIVPQINKDSIVNRYTIYSSQKDKALNMSKKFHKSLRVGSSTSSYKGFETIDISAINCDDVLFHGCFSKSTPVITDIYQLFKSNLRPEDRNLIKKGDHWLIRKD